MKKIDISALVVEFKKNAVAGINNHSVAGLENGYNSEKIQIVTDAYAGSVGTSLSNFKGLETGLESEDISKIIVASKNYFDRTLASRGKPISGISRTKSSNIPGDATVFTAGSLQRGVAADRIELSAGLENFAPTEVDTFTAYSAVYNISASKQSAFAEMFYKPVMQDPLSSSFDLEVDVISTFENVAAPLGGAPYSRNLKSLIKQISTGYGLIREDLRLFPIDRAENAAFVNSDLSFTQSVPGGSEEVAPIKNGIEVDMGNLGLSTALAAKGAVDATDTLARDISVESIYVKVSGTVGGAAKTDILRIPLNQIQYNKFVRKVNGQDVEMDLNEKVNIAFTIKKLKEFVVGDGNGVLDALTDTFSVQLLFRLNGTANLATRSVWTNNTVSLAKVFDAAGNDVTAGNSATTIKAVFNTIAVDSWFPKCYAGNENLRHKGLRITQTSYYVSFPIAYNAPVQYETPVIEMPGNNSDKGLIGALNITGFQMDQSAIKNLLEYKAALRTFESSIYSDEDLYKNLGVASWLVFPKFIERDTNVSEITSNVSSKDYVNDLSSAICADIRDIVIKLTAASRIQDALRVQLGEEKVGVSIGVSTELSAYVTAASLQLGAGYEVNVESTNHTMITDSIIITLSRCKSTSSEDPHILDRGWMVYYPEIAGSAQIQENDGIKNMFICRPGYNHINNMPIMGYIKVSGLETANREIMQRAKVYRLNKQNEIIDN